MQPAALFDSVDNILVDFDSIIDVIIRAIHTVNDSDRDCAKAVEFRLNKKMMKMIVFPGEVGTNCCGINYEVQGNMERLNAT